MLCRQCLCESQATHESQQLYQAEGELAVHDVQGDDMSPERPERSHHTGADMRRTNSFSDWESLHSVWTAAEVIKAAGYPLEQHTVTTSDGYILRMERLPRHGTFSHTSCSHV